MAERRMFAKSVIGSARFLRMPSTSRLLYYDLGMAADDDGVVEAFAVMRTTGATDDDLRVLASRGFVIVLNEDLVAYLTDWKKNNLIKRDRYHPSVYKDLLVQIQSGTQMKPYWSQVGTQMEPEVRLVQSSLEKEREGADKPPRSHFVPPTLEEVKVYCQERKNGVDPNRFFDFYEANGWVQGKGKKIKDWKAAVRTWENMGQDNEQPKTAPRGTYHTEIVNGEEVDILDA